jgi:peptidoglycan/xylan/chitin deacetylase (PgdA/CDA1 family)
MAAGVAFLMYHELELPGRALCQSDPGYTRYIVAASEFDRQMRHLNSAGYQGLSVGQAMEFSGGLKFALTFDDSCETDLIAAAPVLKALGFGATFYATVGFLGQRGYMSEAQLRDLSDADFEVGCHSMTHPYLSDLNDAGLRREIIDAKTRLEQIVGRRVEHFSCPGGRFDERVIEIAKESGYRTLATSRPQLNFRNSDPYCLGRIAILRHTTQDELTRTCMGRGFWKLSAQETVQSTAKRLLGNRVYDRMRAILLGDPASK